MVFFDMLTSSVGKKILTGVTGLGLCVFVIAHLIGNLNLFVGSDAFNVYTHSLESLGNILYVLEAGLAACFLLHAVIGISIYRKKRQARPVAYAKTADAGGTSRKSFASQSMIWTGLILLVFLIIHIKTFKFGTYYGTIVNGIVMRDLYSLVIEKFRDPLYTFGYAAVMILLGFHLRHGFWSAFQSLGMNHERLKPLIYGFGIFFALFIAVGFLILPLWIYFS